MAHFKENDSEKQQKESKEQKQDIVNTFKKILKNTINNYEFYRNNPDLLDLKKKIGALNMDVDYKLIDENFISVFINIINSNNPTTLIGTLQGTQELIRPASSHVIPCFNKELYEKHSVLFRRGDAKIEILYGSKSNSDEAKGEEKEMTDEDFEKTLTFKGYQLL
jgi:hypothetical protein